MSRRAATKEEEEFLKRQRRQWDAKARIASEKEAKELEKTMKKLSELRVETSTPVSIDRNPSSPTFVGWTIASRGLNTKQKGDLLRKMAQVQERQTKKTPYELDMERLKAKHKSGGRSRKHKHTSISIQKESIQKESIHIKSVLE